VNVPFEHKAKYFFWIAGALTTAAALPTMISPVEGFHRSFGLNYFDQSPQVAPVIGHWGLMVAGIGVLLFLSATNKQIRKTTVIYATLEKAYIVSAAVYCFFIHAPYARNYLLALVADGLMGAGGLWYLLRSRALNQV
jgi:hypothetical protein